MYQSKNGATTEVQVKDRIASEGSMPSSMNEKNSVISELRRAMNILSVREAEIIEMRFGLGDGNPMTLEEIGKHFSVTRERIRQIESRALAKMRHPELSSELKENLGDFIDISDVIDSYSTMEFSEALSTV
jgi:RNA polymerase sigma factor (sigma-70 family)